MPYVKVSSNAKRSSVNVEAVLKAVSKSIADALDRPKPYVMVEMELDHNMLLAASTDLCAFVNVCSIGKVDAERNPETVAALTETISKTLSVPAERVYICLNDIAPGNFGAFGNVVG